MKHLKIRMIALQDKKNWLQRKETYDQVMVAMMKTKSE